MSGSRKSSSLIFVILSIVLNLNLVSSNNHLGIIHNYLTNPLFLNFSNTSANNKTPRLNSSPDNLLSHICSKH